MAILKFKRDQYDANNNNNKKLRGRTCQFSHTRGVYKKIGLVLKDPDTFYGRWGPPCNTHILLTKTLNTEMFDR